MFYLWNWQWLLWHSATWLWNTHTTRAQLSQLPVSTFVWKQCMYVPLIKCQAYRYEVCLIHYIRMEDSTTSGLTLIFAGDVSQLGASHTIKHSMQDSGSIFQHVLITPSYTVAAGIICVQTQSGSNKLWVRNTLNFLQDRRIKEERNERVSLIFIIGGEGDLSKCNFLISPY